MRRPAQPRARGVAITTLDAERVFTRLMVNRTEPPNTADLHTKAGFGKTRADGCVVGVNYSDPMAPLLKRIPAPKDSWPPAGDSTRGALGGWASDGR